MSQPASFIDALPTRHALAEMLASQGAALLAIGDALGPIEDAAQRIAAALEQGKTLHYAAAGSSGLMALADASELPGTFRIPQDQIRISMAGGVPVDGVMPGHAEDRRDDASRDARALTKGDVAIVISASGTTPYAVAFADAAGKNGATIVAVANVSAAPLLDLADIPIAVPTAPEVLTGSTRLGAGTAQKVVLNMISTQVGVLLGHVHNGMMVNLSPDNLKLRQRATAIVAQIAEVSQEVAVAALNTSGGDTKVATLVARGIGLHKARELCNHHNGRLPQCHSDLDQRLKTKNDINIQGETL